jgi:hypothetical protein
MSHFYLPVTNITGATKTPPNFYTMYYKLFFNIVESNIVNFFLLII